MDLYEQKSRTFFLTRAKLVVKWRSTAKIRTKMSTQNSGISPPFRRKSCLRRPWTPVGPDLVTTGMKKERLKEVVEDIH